MADYIKALQLWGFKGTLKHFYRFRQIKLGTQVGIDEFGQHRWVEPAVWDAPSLSDASVVPPTWHGWLHHTHDTIPSSSVPSLTGKQIAKHSHAPAEDKHYNMKHRRPWRPNPTLTRQRGHNVEHRFAKPGENDFYVQPGSLMSPRFEATGPRIESWGASPAETTSGNDIAKAKLEPWEEFYFKRQEMNQKR